MDRSLSYDDYNAIRSRDYFVNDDGDSDSQSDDVEQVSDKDYNQRTVNYDDRIEDNREKLQTWDALPPDVYTKGMIFRGQIPVVLRQIFHDREPRIVRLVISRATDLRWGTQRTLTNCFPRRHKPLVQEIPEYLDPPAPIWSPLLGTYYIGTASERKVYYQWRDHPEKRQEIHARYTNLLRERMVGEVTDTLKKIGFSNAEIEILMDTRRRAESEVLSRTSVLSGCQIDSQALMHQFRMAKLTGRKNTRKRKRGQGPAATSDGKRSRFEDAHPKQLMDIRFNGEGSRFQVDFARRNAQMEEAAHKFQMEEARKFQMDELRRFQMEEARKFAMNYRDEMGPMKQQQQVEFRSDVMMGPMKQHQVEFRSDVMGPIRQQQQVEFRGDMGPMKQQQQVEFRGEMMGPMKQQQQVEFRSDLQGMDDQLAGLSRRQRSKIKQRMKKLQLEFRGEHMDKMIGFPEQMRSERPNVDQFQPDQHEMMNKFQVEFRNRRDEIGEQSVFRIDNPRERQGFDERQGNNARDGQFQMEFRNPEMDNPTNPFNRGYQEMGKADQMLVDVRSGGNKNNEMGNFGGEDWRKSREFQAYRGPGPKGPPPLHSLEAPPSTETPMVVRNPNPNDRLWDRRSSSPPPPPQVGSYANRPAEEMPINEMAHAINTMKDLDESQRVIQNLDAFQVLQMKKVVRELRDLSNHFVDSSTRDSRHTRDFFKAAITDIMEAILSPYTFRSLPRAIAAWNVVEANGLQVPPALQESWSRLVPSRASLRAALWKSDSKAGRYEELRAELAPERDGATKYRAAESREMPDYLEPAREMMARQLPDSYWGQWKSMGGDAMNK